VSGELFCSETELKREAECSAAVVEGLAGWVPPHAVTNAELPADWDVDDAWVRRRTGIGVRHWAAPGTSTGDLALEAAVRALAVSTLALLRHPEQTALLRERPELVPGAVEELLRQQTIIHLGLARVARESGVVAGTTVAAGDGVILMLSTANLDEGLFASAGGTCPEELDITRDARRHLAFGFGIHQCLGQALARAELQISLETLLRRLPGLRLAVP